MYGCLKVELLNVGNVFQNTTEVDVSFLMTYFKKEGGSDDFDIDRVFIKNSMGMSDMKLVHDDKKYVSVFGNVTLNMINNLKHIPFNRQFIFLEIETTCKNVVVESRRIIKLNDYNMKKTIGGNTHMFVWEYNVGLTESLLKYMVIPYLLTLVLQLSHTIKAEDEEGGHGTWISVGSTFMLTDVALFFTVPQTNKLTYIDKSLFLSLLMKIFITMFAFYDFDVKISNKLENFSHHDVDAVLFGLMTMIILIYSSYNYYKSKRGGNNILNLYQSRNKFEEV